MQSKWHLGVSFLAILTSCTNTNASSSSQNLDSYVSTDSSELLTSEISSNSQEDSTATFSTSEDSLPSSASVYTPLEEEFRYLGQSWRSMIDNTGPLPQVSGNTYHQVLNDSSVILGTHDSQGYSENTHGSRMMASLNHYYPDTSIEGIRSNAIYTNYPYYDPSDYQSGIHVNSMEIPAPYNFYALASFVESQKENPNIKLFMTATENVVTYNQARLNNESWAVSAWRTITSKSGTEVAVPLPDYQFAHWLEMYGAKHNVLFLEALENNSMDDSYQAVNCFSETLVEGYEPICGGEAYAITTSGEGLDRTLFVGHYDERFDQIVGWATGPYAENAIYSPENSIDHSNSHTVPTVTGFLASLIELRREEGLAELTALEWKSILLNSAENKVTHYIDHYVEGTVVLGDITVKLLNKEAATECATTLNCFN